MKTRLEKDCREPKVHSSELLILGDGRIMAHNISPVMARVLSELDPADQGMHQRANQKMNDEIPG
jgi:hypothetical protein